jgi:glycosyltransferase involved in cell wall biosynthesis
VEALSRGVPILLNSVDDLRRFELPEKHYCASSQEFAERIAEFKSNLDSLVASSEIASQILVKRKPEIVAEKWIKFLSKL